jgi:hypothetical protein
MKVLTLNEMITPSSEMLEQMFGFDSGDAGSYGDPGSTFDGHVVDSILSKYPHTNATSITKYISRLIFLDLRQVKRYIRNDKLDIRSIKQLIKDNDRQYFQFGKDVNPIWTAHNTSGVHVAITQRPSRYSFNLGHVDLDWEVLDYIDKNAYVRFIRILDDEDYEEIGLVIDTEDIV